MNIRKWEKDIANAEKEMKKLNTDIEKATNGKLPEAEKKVQNADKAVIEAQAIVEKWRQLAQ